MAFHLRSTVCKLCAASRSATARSQSNMASSEIRKALHPTTSIRLLSAVSVHDAEDDNTDLIDYESPLQELFDRMEAGGPTALGTTEYVPARTKLLKCGVAEEDLRFTTTHYGRLMLAPHVHPNEHRVTLKVPVDKFPFATDTDTGRLELDILRHIVGPRLNDEHAELRLTSSVFGSRIENKRHLVSMLDRIILSSQRLASEIQNQQNAEEDKK